MQLPHNIERRLFRTDNAARYRAWDGAGRMYFIFGQSGAWVARSRDGSQPSVFAPTFDRLSDKLGARS